MGNPPLLHCAAGVMCEYKGRPTSLWNFAQTLDSRKISPRHVAHASVVNIHCVPEKRPPFYVLNNSVEIFLHLTGEVNKCASYLCQIFSGFNVQKIIKFGEFLTELFKK